MNFKLKLVDIFFEQRVVFENDVPVFIPPNISQHRTILDFEVIVILKDEILLYIHFIFFFIGDSFSFIWQPLEHWWLVNLFDTFLLWFSIFLYRFWLINRFWAFTNLINSIFKDTYPLTRLLYLFIV